jgi:ABC-2 type transport system ATP-binding protein
MGQRSQPNWDIPAIDSYDLYRAIYGIPMKEYLELRDEMIELMQLGDLVNKPVRNLSLGERMKAEAVGALLHRPKVLFLDEPTIGLDVTMQRRIRRFIQEYNQRYEATVLLTSHYMADVQALCKRVIVIHHGTILYDGALSGLVDRFSAMKTLVVTTSDMNGSQPDMSTYGSVISAEPNRIALRVSKQDAPQVTARLLADLPVTDLTVEDPPIEEVIESVFDTPNQNGKDEAEAE